MLTQWTDANPLNRHSLLVLKLPRSGSSYFASMLSQQDGVWLVPQLIRPSKVPRPAETLMLLTKALDQPFKAKKEDLQTLQNHALQNHAHITVGYSINPLLNASSTFIDSLALQRILTARKTTVVLYQRTNVVKQTIATMRGTCLSKLCGVNNRINTEALPFWTKSHVLLHGINSIHNTSCSIAKRHRYPIEELQCIVVWHIEAYVTLQRFANSIAESFVTVNYEDLQRDANATLQRLFGVIDDNVTKRTIRSRQFLVKQTNEDLREVILNFDEVLQSFGDNGLMQ